MSVTAAELKAGNDRETAWLVNRVTYGADREMLERAANLGYEGFVDWQLDYRQIDDGALESELERRLPSLTMTARQLAAYVREDEGRPGREMGIATIARQTFSRRQLFERMVEFWTDHFNVYVANQALAFLKPLEDRDVIRPNAMERFEPLLQADAKSPAMLYYLDNFNNTADGPNENYARELMELHTLGVDGGYTEEDVKEAARCFTGWTIARPARFRFDAASHDPGAKRIMALDLAPGGGVADGERLLAYLANHDATAGRLALKLAQRFVGDNPDAGLVERVAASFTASGGDIRATLRTLLLDPVTRQTPPVNLKRPNGFLAGLLRGLEVRPGDLPFRELFGALETMGHVPFRWPAPNGYPDADAYWQSSIGFLTRFNTAFAWTRALAGRSPLLQAASALRGPAEITDFLATVLTAGRLDPAARATIVARVATRPEIARPPEAAALLAAGPAGQWR